jgi:hypothetical protein
VNHSMRVAIVRDWLTVMRGAERCLDVLCELFPNADLYSLLYSRHNVSRTIRSMKVHASWINGLPGISRYYRYYLLLFPHVIEKFSLRGVEGTAFSF